MIQMSQSRESQLILQTTDTVKRLSAQNKILMQACDMITQELLKNRKGTNHNIVVAQNLTVNLKICRLH